MIAELENPKTDFDIIGAMKTQKPLIKFNVDSNTFYRDGKKITKHEARLHWHNADAEWDMKAYEEIGYMIEFEPWNVP